MENIEKQQALQKIINLIESSTEFVKGQLPDFVDQYIRAATIKTWLDFSVSVIAFSFFLGTTIYAIKKAQTNDEHFNRSFFAMFFSVFSPVLCIFTGAAALDSLHKLINIYVAPKVFILENLRNMLK